MKLLLSILLICFVGCNNSHVYPSFVYKDTLKPGHWYLKGVDVCYEVDSLMTVAINSHGDLFMGQDTMYVIFPAPGIVIDPPDDTTKMRVFSRTKISIDSVREPWFQLNRPNGKIDSIGFSSIQSVTILYKGEIKTIRIDSMKANGSNTWLKPKHKQ